MPIKEKCETDIEDHKWVKQPDKTFVCKNCGLWVKKLSTTIQISIKTKKRLIEFDEFISKEYPTHEDRVIWLMNNLLPEFKKVVKNV